MTTTLRRRAAGVATGLVLAGAALGGCCLPDGGTPPEPVDCFSLSRDVNNANADVNNLGLQIAFEQDPILKAGLQSHLTDAQAVLDAALQAYDDANCPT